MKVKLKPMSASKIPASPAVASLNPRLVRGRELTAMEAMTPGRTALQRACEETGRHWAMIATTGDVSQPGQGRTTVHVLVGTLHAIVLDRPCTPAAVDAALSEAAKLLEEKT